MPLCPGPEGGSRAGGLRTHPRATRPTADREPPGVGLLVADPEDRRGVLVELTAKGTRAYHAAAGAEAAKEALITSALNERERAELNTLLRRLMIEFERREDA